MAQAAGLSRAHFSRSFARTFGVTPHAYLLTRRLERAASLLRITDRSVLDICLSVGLQSVGSFTTSFTRILRDVADGVPPGAPARGRLRVVPSCVVRAYGRPARVSTNGEDSTARRP